MKGFAKNIRLNDNKSLEIEFDRFSIDEARRYFCIKLEWTTKTDHAGLEFNIELLGWYFSVIIYDHRHWDYENEKWNVYTENEKE